MIEIELPDATIAEFPEGTAREVIQSALQKRFGAQPQPSGQGTLNNVAQQAGDGVLFGFGDEISARLNAMTGYDAATGTYGNRTTYADQLAAVRAQERQFEADHPVLAPVAEVGGALVTAAVPAGLAMRGGSLASRVGAAGLAGAAQGAAYGFGEGERGVKDRARNAAWAGGFGGLLGIATPVLGAGARKLVEKAGEGRALRAAAKGAPSIDELRARANAIYAEADKVSNLPRPALAEALAGTLEDANRLGLDDMLHPSASRVAVKMSEAGAKEGPVGFRELDILRRQAQVPAGNVTNRSEQAIGSRMIEGIDGYMDDASPSLASALGEARDMWSRMRKAETIQRMIDTGDAYTSGKASGIRNQARSLVKSPKASRGYTAAEKAALTRLANPGFVEHTLAHIGGGLGNTAAMLGGYNAGGVAGGIAGNVLSAAARGASEAITTRKAQLVQALIANGGEVALPTLTKKQQALIEALYMAGMRPSASALAEALSVK